MSISAAAPLHYEDESRNKIRERIIETLKVYPVLSLTMLQSHVRPYGAHWRQVLEDLVNEGVVVRGQVQQGNRWAMTHRLADTNHNHN